VQSPVKSLNWRRFHAEFAKESKKAADFMDLKAPTAPRHNEELFAKSVKSVKLSMAFFPQ
jgi:hypothetical protein